jgi:hypothetical protein
VSDSETRETLVAICETLKAQYIALGSLQRGFYAFFQAAQHYHPDIQEKYDKAAVLALSSDNPATREQIERLDALLQQLRKRT